MEYNCCSICRSNGISKTTSSSSVHLLVVPFPTQGHVVPMMELVHRLADQGLTITILTTEGSHARMMLKQHPRSEIKIVTFPDGLETEEDTRDDLKVVEGFYRVMPDETHNFIKDFNHHQKKIVCIISDIMNIWCTETAIEMGLKLALFFPPALGCMATCQYVPNLLDQGIIDDQGSSNRNEEIMISPYLPVLRNSDFPWRVPGNLLMQQMFFELMLSYEQYQRSYNWIIGNWFHDLDPSVDNLLPNILSVGPLIGFDSGRPSENLFTQDMSCLTWLDEQLPGSVIYVAFGSTGGAKCRQQFQEIAFGLELIGKPFLWVVKTNLADGLVADYPDGFEERVANYGRMVEWAPQQQVLAHPSVACFFSHVGWNSTLESLWNGIPILCWPFMGDQLYNRTCICYGWKIGLEVKADENGIITRHELKLKVDKLLSNSGIRSNMMKLKSLARKSTSKGGSSSKNLEKFVSQLKHLSL